jgi:hypothetical protein
MVIGNLDTRLKYPGPNLKQGGWYQVSDTSGINIKRAAEGQQGA